MEKYILFITKHLKSDIQNWHHAKYFWESLQMLALNLLLLLSFIFSRDLLKLLMNTTKFVISTRSNIGLKWYRGRGFLIWIWLDYATIWLFRSCQRKADGPLQILFFEINVLFYLIFKEMNVRAYAIEIKALLIEWEEHFKDISANIFIVELS